MRDNIVNRCLCCALYMASNGDVEHAIMKLMSQKQVILNECLPLYSCFSTKRGAEENCDGRVRMRVGVDKSSCRQEQTWMRVRMTVDKGVDEYTGSYQG